MNSSDVAAFFDSLAENWDARMTTDDEIVNAILDDAQIGAGAHVLDAACGTGVLIPYYLSRGVSQITGVDLSSEMIRRARAKFRDARIEWICQDVQTLARFEAFDRIVLYNALPHFDDPAALFARLFRMLRPEGRLTVAHAAGRETINARHIRGAQDVSVALPAARDIAALMQPYARVDVVRDEKTLYVVSAVKMEVVHD